MATARAYRGVGRIGGLILLGLLGAVSTSLLADDVLPPVVRGANRGQDDQLIAPFVGGQARDEGESKDASKTPVTPTVASASESPALAPIATPTHSTQAAVPFDSSRTKPLSLNRPIDAATAGTFNVATLPPYPSMLPEEVLPVQQAIEPVVSHPPLPMSHSGPQDEHHPYQNSPIFRSSTMFRTSDAPTAATDPRYDRVLDLFPDANDRRMVQSVREAVEQTEIGIDTTDERWITVRGGQRITWGGRIETDYVNWIRDDEFRGVPFPLPIPPAVNPDGQQDYVEFRRLRLFAAGEGYGVFDYQLEFDFAEDRVQVEDAYVGMRDLPWIGYGVIGHFRVPIGLSHRTSSRYIPFMERSLPTRLLPGRELGLAVFNRTLAGNATWSFGAFFDDVDDEQKRLVDDNQGTRAVARATWTPIYDELSRGRCFLHTGIGYLYTRPRRRDDPLNSVSTFRPVEFSARPEIHRGDPLIQTGPIFTDQYHTSNVEISLANGPITVQSELTWTSLERTGGGSENLYGAYVYGSWFLTGERRPYDRDFGVFGRVIPYENFWVVNTDQGKRTGWGAWELAFRWSYLSFAEVNLDGVDGQYLNDLTAGLNWYWNPQTRLMLNWIHPFARNSFVGTNPDDDSEGDIIAMRLAVEF